MQYLHQEHILVVNQCLKNPFKYPYYIHEFDITENVIEDSQENYEGKLASMLHHGAGVFLL